MLPRLTTDVESVVGGPFRLFVLPNRVNELCRRSRIGMSSYGRTESEPADRPKNQLREGVR